MKQYGIVLEIIIIKCEGLLQTYLWLHEVSTQLVNILKILYHNLKK
jgi:hypothetical protein